MEYILDNIQINNMMSNMITSPYNNMITRFTDYLVPNNRYKRFEMNETKKNMKKYQSSSLEQRCKLFYHLVQLCKRYKLPSEK